MNNKAEVQAFVLAAEREYAQFVVMREMVLGVLNAQVAAAQKRLEAWQQTLESYGEADGGGGADGSD